MNIKVKLKDVKLTDGSMTYNVQVYANNGNGKPRVIISCDTARDQLFFADELDKLIRKYTVDKLEFK